MSKIVDGIKKDVLQLKSDCKVYLKELDIKKVLLMNIPYFFAGYFCNKVSAAWRLSSGDFLDKLVTTMNEISTMINNPLPSFHYKDLIIGVVGAVALKIVIYVKGKNAKKFRHGSEYGSARWGDAKDIKPFMDCENEENNILLTETEKLMLRGRASKPKYERNKNVMVVGGSGSGKTRFFVKPNLMQMHSSYVVTDPKG